MSVEKDIQALLPSLKRFARSLCRDAVKADDLVQETFLKAWQNLDSYEEGTNLRAWLFTILRNTHLSELRRLRKEVEDVDGLQAERMRAADDPEWHVRMKDLAWAWHSLPFDQQEALMLVGVEGMSYDDVAEILGCATGTIKSRVNRAREKLADILGEELPKSAVDNAWDKMQEYILLAGEDDMPTILNDAAE